MTGSGKTTLAVWLAKTCRSPILVFDPFKDRRWPRRATVTDDKDEFLRIAAASRGCLVIADESSMLVGQFDRESHWLGTQARHLGHSVLFISQRPQQISPNVRGQCEAASVFGMAATDGEIIGKEFNAQEFEACGTLPKWHFLYGRRFAGVHRMKVTKDGPRPAGAAKHNPRNRSRGAGEIHSGSRLKLVNKEIA